MAFFVSTLLQPPAKAPPKVYQILVRSHRLTIFLTLAPTGTIASLKNEVLSALTSEGNQTEEEVPQVTSVDEFEICKAVKASKGAASTEYEVLDGKQFIRDCRLANWDIVFLQFRDSSTGKPRRAL